jgi:hypothetical protein
MMVSPNSITSDQVPIVNSQEWRGSCSHNFRHRGIVKKTTCSLCKILDLIVLVPNADRFTGINYRYSELPRRDDVVIFDPSFVFKLTGSAQY